MWAEAGQNLDSFWGLTPHHFQVVMRGVRRRMKAEAENRTAQAWQTGAFTGATQSKGGLKPLRHYLKQEPQPMSAAAMLANMRSLVGRVNGSASR